MNDSKIRAIAIYLPQFHPMPENDEWWGKGFTEWTNVTKAASRFDGHYQPHLPADLGFYDLRLHEARLAQEELAKEYGIYGFCYYHYWFNGKRLLHEPLDRKLQNPEENLPFMLCWANETWSRRWLGEDKEILIKQEYSLGDDEKHAKWLCDQVFGDKRYITINNRPVFMIYRPHDLHNYKDTLEVIRIAAINRGLQTPYFIASNSHSSDLDGFDHIMNFEPQLSLLEDAFVDGRSAKKLKQNIFLGKFSSKLKIYEYGFVKKLMANRRFPYKYLPSVFVGWDNSARRGENGIIIINQNKTDFKKSLELAAEKVSNYPKQEQIVFINAWNEWAEGNHLEPCSKYGHQFLEAVREVFGSEKTASKNKNNE